MPDGSSTQEAQSRPKGFTGTLSMLIESDGGGSGGRGLLFHAARDVSDRDVVTMAGQGGICTVTINETTMIRLGLVPQSGPPAAGETPYLVNSVEARACTETGIAARERALTMRTLGSKDVDAAAIHSPGHVMVQVARNILRPGASLPELANLLLAATSDTRFAAWTDILDESGDLATAAQCHVIAERLGAPVHLAEEVVRLGRERLGPWVEVVEFSKTREQR